MLKENNNLKFQNEVLDKFKFLVKKFGFECNKIDNTEKGIVIYYLSEKVFFNIYYDNYSYEIDFSIGLNSDNEKTARLSEIIELSGAINEIGNTYFQTTSKEGIEIVIYKIASFVEKYAATALLGDIETFRELELIRQQKSNKYMKEMRLNKLRSIAEEAWQNKKYKEFVDLYAPIREDLCVSELKKLEYAEKHLEK